jgi:hypothetical protein
MTGFPSYQNSSKRSLGPRGELDAGHAAVGVLTWDFETEAVSDKLTELGGTPPDA